MDLKLVFQNASFPHYVEHISRKKKTRQKGVDATTKFDGQPSTCTSISDRKVEAELSRLVSNPKDRSDGNQPSRYSFLESLHYSENDDCNRSDCVRGLDTRSKTEEDGITSQICGNYDENNRHTILEGADSDFEVFPTSSLVTSKFLSVSYYPNPQFLYSSLPPSFLNLVNTLMAFLVCVITGRTYRNFHTPLKCIILFFLVCGAHGFCPTGCQCNDDTLRVECKNASLNVVPFLLNPGIKYLKLPCNKIASLGQSLAFYPELVALDLSYNALTSINLSDFESQSTLKVFKLNNNKISALNNQSFSGLDNIEELYLNDNNIGHLEPLSFDNLENLLFLDLSNNKLRSLSQEELQPLKKLEVLILNFNRFHNPNQIGFLSLPSLEKLELNGNTISSVPTRAFYQLQRLLTLSLDKNGINTISKTAFAGLSNLTSLSIVDNRLAYIPRDALVLLPNLRSLDASGNMFQSIQRQPFRSMKQLEKLSISRCPRMSIVGPNAFWGLGNLRVLDLSYNARLVQVGEAAFSSLRNLQELDLTACGIIYIDPSQMPQGRSTRLHLAGNPLHCNCSLLWLAKMPTNATFYLDEPTCATPPELYGVGLTKVDLQKAGCETRLGLTAVGICIGVALLGLLIIGLFLIWRWRKREISSAKTIPYYGSRRDRLPPGTGLQSHPQHPPYHTPPAYTPKQPFNQTVPFSQYSLHQCHRECQGIGSCPYSLHPATRPLLPPPTPSPTAHPFLPSEWLYPSPYEEDTHWYTTIGRDGREYLTGEPKKSDITPSPVHSSSSSFRNSTPKLKRNNSTSTRPSPSLVSSADTPPTPGVPVTYI